MNCEHTAFDAHVRVNRLQNVDGDIDGFMAGVIIRCRDCGQPFQFFGMPGGLRANAPSCSVDRTEARLPIGPRTGPIGVPSRILFEVPNSVEGKERDEMMRLKPCKCGNDVLEFMEEFLDDRVRVCCPECYESTFECATRQDAADAWNGGDTVPDDE